ncbi:MAG: AraC family transcriptional regulator [Victivallaceae bacterium]|nr:AraC family transcriptional regulator [Victivallaceae bacterium]
MLEKIKRPIAADKYEVHRAPKGIQQIHRDYGLWLIGGGVENTTAPDSFLRCRARYFEFYSISHMHQGAGRLWLEPEREYEVKAGQCIIICPGTLNRYGGIDGKPYVEDSLQFCGPVVDMLHKAGIVRDGVFDFGEGRRLLPVIKLLRDPAADSQINANIALQKLLVDIYNESRRLTAAGPDSAVDRLIAAVKEQTERWWTVEEMAEFCNLSDDQFRRLFFRRTGMLPKIYIDRLKMQKAGELLKSRRLKVTEIAQRLGYVDQYHFSRRFKKLTGMSPRRYRQAFSLDA